MRVLNRLGLTAMLAMSAVLAVAGCKSNQDPNTAYAGQGGVQDVSQDPATANQAPVSSDSGAPAYTGQSSPQDASAGYPQSTAQYSDDSGYGDQPVEYAPDPPPPLPDYDQPPAPGDDYLWTPGYWNYAQDGYYWVPGVWVQAPYQGALWTPGYWGWSHNRYGFHRGYWGRHIGYYGGIDYGFGYVGFGYQGGYWNGGHFDYNRSVNNVDTRVVHNVYSYNVSEGRGGNRVSFNGGQGGLQVRPRPAELAAIREPHAAPMSAQVQNERAAATDKAQFANVNHGRPAAPVVTRPLVADHGVRVPPPAPMQTQPAMQQRAPVENRPNAGQPTRENMPVTQQAAPQRQAQQPLRQEAPQHQPAPQRQAEPQRQQPPQTQTMPQRQVAPQRQPEPQHPAPPQHPIAPQRQEPPQRQQTAAPPMQQHQAPPPQHVAPPPSRPTAPPPPHAAPPPPHAAPPPHPAPAQKPDEHPEKK